MVRSSIRGLILLVPGLLGGCSESRPQCAACGTVVVAAIAEPSTLVPPLVYETVGRDISDQVFERLAYLAPGASPIDVAAYRPGLAERWERLDSVTWRFHLRPGAAWHDGRPVTAGDVVFSFEAFSDSIIDAAARTALAGVQVSANDSNSVNIRFPNPSPEQLYDATYHVRILPRHIWAPIPRDRWATDTSVSHLVGSGRYRVQEWRRGQFVELGADTLSRRAEQPAVRRAIWRFVSDPDAALNLILAHEADLMEAAGAPDRVRRVQGDSSFRIVNYPAGIYGFLAFRVADASGRPHPVLGNRGLRRALTAALDRPTISRAVFGPDVKVPPGPMSQLLWIWDDRTQVLPFDSSSARASLGKLLPETGGRAIDILVPATSSTRKQLALAIQEAWRRAGVTATVTAVEFPIFQERLAKGRFDSYIGAYLDEPSPRGLSDQWSRAGWGVLNYGRYANPVFDSLLVQASSEQNVRIARRLWREAMDTLNADAPAIFLYAPANAAVVHRRLGDVKLNPYSWLSGLPGWEVNGDRVWDRGPETSSRQ